MPQITLASYSVRVREPHAKVPLQLNDPKVAGLFAFFEGYFQSLVGVTHTNAGTKKVHGVRSMTVIGPELSGILVTGEFGYEAQLIDTKKKKKPYQRSSDEAELLPFFVHLYLPANGECGILLLQRFGIFGIRSILTAHLTEKFAIAYPGLSLNIWPQIPDGVLDAILGKGSLRTVTLRKSSLSADICDALGENPKSDPGRIDVVISSKKNHNFEAVLQKVRNIINGAKPKALNEVVEIEGFDHDKILLEIEIGDRKQTVDLSDFNKLRAHIDVTKKVKYGPDGHPTLASIKAESDALLKSLRKTLNV